MGTSKENRTRLRLDENDLPKINLITRELMKSILDSFPTTIIQDKEWPLRYLLNKNETEFEFIFSQMGSVTLRLAKSDRYRRNPPPIFYISVGKYDSNDLIWEDLNAIEIDVTKDSLVQKINESIQNYFNAMSI